MGRGNSPSAEIDKQECGDVGSANDEITFVFEVRYTVSTSAETTLRPLSKKEISWSKSELYLVGLGLLLVFVVSLSGSGMISLKSISVIAIAYELSSGAIIQRSSGGNRFGIYLRSGSDVRIERGGTNVYISLPAFDKGLTRGLCGTSDSIPGNYFLHPDGKKDSSCSQKCNPNAFFQAWRPNGNSSVLCSARQHLQRINAACHNCPVITDLLVPSNTVGVGWVRPGSSKPEPPFVHPDVKPAGPNKRLPSDQGYTEAQARDMCTQTTQKSQLYPQCQRFDQLVNTSISDCLADILFGGTSQFLDDITSAFTSQCQLILSQNPDNYDINAEGDPVIKPELLDNVCPIECSKHGQCRDKCRCQCQDEWEGETCLIETGKGPQLVEI